MEAMDAADQALIERLRAKYMGAQTGVSDELAESVSRVHVGEGGAGETSSHRVRDVTDIKVTACATCHGTGKAVENYGFRVMEMTCSACGGDGCITSGGKGANETQAPEAPKVYQAEEELSAEAIAAKRREKEDKCRRDADKIRKRLAKYAAEEEQARGELESANPEKRALLTHFLSELDKAVGELKQQLKKREDLISRYEALCNGPEHE